jgi:hypothetical protein
MSNTARTQAKVVRIYLNRSIDAKGFETAELIHQQELEMAEQFIRRKIDEPKTDKEHRPHDAIAVFGTRGSGKTTFLLSLKRIYEDSKEVQVLPIIDPTLIEEKGHVFLNIITVVQELVEARFTKDEQLKTEGTKPTRRDWKLKLLRLSGGLPAIDGLMKELPDGWTDPEYILETGLQAVESAKNLEQNFADLLQMALDILGRKVFLLFFDDIDVDARKGFSVLETIRKYLTKARLVTILSGDDRLYSIAIRQSKWENFGPDILKWEGQILGRIADFNNLVTELTSQYFLKVLQPKYRIHLTTLLEKRQFASLERRQSASALPIEIISTNQALGEEANIERIYSYLIAKAGVRNRVQQEVYITFLLGLSLRTQIQFFIAAEKLYGYNEAEKNNALATEIFMEDLLDKRVNVNLATHTPKFLSAIMLKLLLQQKKLLDLYQLQPSSDDSSLNGAMLSLWMLFGRYVERGNLFLIFDYFIKVAYVRNLLSVLPYQDSVSTRPLVSPSIEGLCNTGDVYNDGVLRDVVSAMQAYLFGVLELRGAVAPISPFFIRLNRYRDPLDEQRGTIHQVFEGADPVLKALGFIPCLDATYITKNESRTLYSVYVLIGAIGEIVKRAEIVQTERLLSEITEALNQLSQFRSYPIPDLVDDLRRTAEGADEQGTALEEEEKSARRIKDLSALAKLVTHWLSKKPTTAYSTHLLGKILTRFYYSMNNIAAGAQRRKDFGLGRLFHLQIAAFMNAALVEDVSENLEGAALNINNTRISDRLFVDNMSKVTARDFADDGRIQLSKWLLSCPLLIAYLEPSTTLRQQILRFGKGIAQPASFAFGVAKLLDMVQIYNPKVRLEGSPSLLDDPPELIEFLKQNGIRKVYFQRSSNSKTTKDRENSIIRRVSSVFGTGKQAIDNITRFRRYLRTHPEAWK